MWPVLPIPPCGLVSARKEREQFAVLKGDTLGILVVIFPVIPSIVSTAFARRQAALAVTLQQAPRVGILAEVGVDDSAHVQLPLLAILNVIDGEAHIANDLLVRQCLHRVRVYTLILLHLRQVLVDKLLRTVVLDYVNLEPVGHLHRL